VALGIVYAAFSAIQGNPELFVFMIPYALGLILLVVGTPGKARLILGSVFFGLYLLLLAGIVTLAITGQI
jgi:hypothetical protein